MLWPAVVVTVTKYEVAWTPAGALAVIVVDETTVTFVAARVDPPVATPPVSGMKLTVAPLTKPVPWIVTVVDVEPPVGEMLATVG